MQKEPKAEFWTKISEISFQVMRRKWPDLKIYL